jgi:hypothetical protein
MNRHIIISNLQQLKRETISIGSTLQDQIELAERGSELNTQRILDCISDIADLKNFATAIVNSRDFISLAEKQDRGIR